MCVTRDAKGVRAENISSLEPMGNVCVFGYYFLSRGDGLKNVPIERKKKLFSLKYIFVCAFAKAAPGFVEPFRVFSHGA